MLCDRCMNVARQIYISEDPGDIWPQVAHHDSPKTFKEAVVCGWPLCVCLQEELTRPSLSGASIACVKGPSTGSFLLGRDRAAQYHPQSEIPGQGFSTYCEWNRFPTVERVPSIEQLSWPIRFYRGETGSDMQHRKPLGTCQVFPVLSTTDSTSRYLTADRVVLT